MLLLPSMFQLVWKHNDKGITAKRTSIKDTLEKTVARSLVPPNIPRFALYLAIFETKGCVETHCQVLHTQQSLL